MVALLPLSLFISHTDRCKDLQEADYQFKCTDINALLLLVSDHSSDHSDFVT